MKQAHEIDPKLVRRCARFCRDIVDAIGDDHEFPFAVALRVFGSELGRNDKTRGRSLPRFGHAARKRFLRYAASASVDNVVVHLKKKRELKFFGEQECRVKIKTSVCDRVDSERA